MGPLLTLRAARRGLTRDLRPGCAHFPGLEAPEKLDVCISLSGRLPEGLGMPSFRLLQRIPLFFYIVDTVGRHTGDK